MEVKVSISTPVSRSMKISCDVDWMKRAHVRGIVVGNSIMFADPIKDIPVWLFKHELEHAYQQIREGVIFFYLKYFYFSVRYGYQNNPFEVEARDKQDEPLTPNEEQLLWKLKDV